MHILLSLFIYYHLLSSSWQANSIRYLWMPFVTSPQQPTCDFGFDMVDMFDKALLQETNG